MGFGIASQETLRMKLKTIYCEKQEQYLKMMSADFLQQTKRQKKTLQRIFSDVFILDKNILQ